jgi:hypothetical protein
MSGVLNVLVASGGRALNALTLTTGTFSDADESEVGYRTYTRTYGSVSSADLQDSTTLASLYWYALDVAGELSYTMVMRITGFGGDPGATYIDDVVIDGVSLGAPGAPTYSSGAATWTWDDDSTDPFTASPPSSVIIFYG